jgi:hypothetical protein
LGNVGFLTEKTFKAMCIGAYPFVVGVAGSENKLKELGFMLLDNTYDMHIGNQRIIGVIDAVEHFYNDQPNTLDHVLHNFNRISDINFLVHLLTAPLGEIANESCV